jgi:hypothetical protein
MIFRIFLLIVFSLGVCSIGSAQIGHWKLNNDALDASANGINGALLNSPTFSTDRKEGSHAILLDGVNQGVNLGNPTAFPSGSSARTISGWAKTNTLTGDHMIFAYGTASTGQAMFIGQQGANLFAGGFDDNLTVSNFWATGVWHHVCLTYDGTTAKLYADGVLVTSSAKSWSLVKSVAFIGKHLTNIAYWNGSIDDVRIYNTALTASEVSALASLTPANPTNLVATVISGSQVNLTWTDASTNESGFEIERSTTSGSGYAVITTTAANAVSYSNTGLTEATTYYYRVRAINGSGGSGYTTQVTATTPLALPGNLTASQISSSLIGLTWTDNSSVETGYQIERSTTTGSGYTLVTTTAANSTSYNDPGLSQNTTYYYRIRAAGTGNNSLYTSEISRATKAPSTQPVAHWRLDNNANDASGNGANGTLVSSPTFTTSDKKEGTHAVVVNGSTSYLNFDNPQHLPSGLSPRTISAWAKTTTATGDHVIFSYGTNNSNKAMYIGQRGTTLWGGGINSSGVDMEVANFWATNVWHHICLTYDGTNAKLYADGTLVLTSAKSWNLALLRCYIGRHVNSLFWGGTIDDVRIYDRALSATEVASIASTTLPVAPTNLVAVASSTSQINLTWADASGDEAGFEIERASSASGPFGLIYTAAANSTSYSNTGLVSGTTYYYRVRAINSGGPSPFTSTVSATTPALPAAPSNLVAATASTTSINLSWTDNSTNETGFQIERTLESGVDFVLIHTTSANATSYSNTGLQSGVTYYYRIRALNASGTSQYTAQASGKTTPLLPAAPTLPTSVAASSTSIAIGWADNSDNESGFQIERSLSANGGFTLVGTTFSNSVSYFDDELSANTNYYYRIRAINTGGYSTYTSAVNATTLIPAPSVPTNVIVNATSPTAASLSWTDNALNEQEIEVERSIMPNSAFTLIATLPANTVSYTDANLTPGNTYYYRIRTTNAGGKSAYTAERAVNLPLENANTMCQNIFCDENGGVGIGTNNIPAGYRVAVGGKIMAEGVKVELQSNWPDYVFDLNYKLTDIQDLKKYIDENGHLPNVPSARTIEENGIDLEKINVVLLEKIEEMSLYLIQMEERMKKLEEENERLRKTSGKSSRKSSN